MALRPYKTEPAVEDRDLAPKTRELFRKLAGAFIERENVITAQRDEIRDLKLQLTKSDEEKTDERHALAEKADEDLQAAFAEVKKLQEELAQARRRIEALRAALLSARSQSNIPSLQRTKSIMEGKRGSGQGSTRG